MDKTSYKGIYILTIGLLTIAVISGFVPIILEYLWKTTFDTAYIYVICFILLLWLAKIIIFSRYRSKAEFISGWERFFKKAKYIPITVTVMLGIFVFAFVNLGSF